MPRPFTIVWPVLVGLVLAGCSSLSPSKQRGSPVRISGVITNKTILAGRPLCVTLRVTNKSGSALYVPRHFNSVNCGFFGRGVGFNYHGDGALPAFEDFMRLGAGQTMEISASFPMRQAGKGEFSVSFYANLEPEVRQKLQQTGTPFIAELEHSFGTIIVQATNERSGVDAGQASLFALLRPCPGATHRERLP